MKYAVAMSAALLIACPRTLAECGRELSACLGCGRSVTESLIRGYRRHKMVYRKVKLFGGQGGFS